MWFLFFGTVFVYFLGWVVRVSRVNVVGFFFKRWIRGKRKIRVGFVRVGWLEVGGTGEGRVGLD